MNVSLTTVQIDYTYINSVQYEIEELLIESRDTAQSTIFTTGLVSTINQSHVIYAAPHHIFGHISLTIDEMLTN